MIESYSLDIDLDFERALIRGIVSIRSIDTQDKFELDAKELKIKSVMIDGKSVQFQYDQEKEMVLVSNLPKGDITFSVEYEKQISDKATTGVYKCRYGSEYFIITDFEPDRARTFFPCKDNPAWKAVFNLSVATRKDLKAISNTTIEKIEDLSDGRRKFTFHQTPKMATYLLFLGVGNFAEKASPDKQVIVASRPEMAGKLDFTLEVASKVLKESERYFGVPYPLEKLHVIALSEYNGAMENWGAITASEIITVIDKSSTAFDKRAGAIVTAHEIQHQWFGDLVTMKWWNDIWLNEGFATFMSYKIVDRLYPKWDCWGEFLLRFGFQSMNIDKLSLTHPVEVKLKSASEMNDVFDFTSYGKGASILRMIESFLGEDSFRKGISSYTKRYSFSNAASDDLWKSLESATGQPVANIMQAWVKKPGFPIVSVENKGNKLVLHQKRFRLTEQNKGEELWPIPIVMQVNGMVKNFLFSSEKEEIDVPGGSLSQLKLNLGQTGFYCVQYDKSIYAMLEEQFPSLDDLDKAGLMNDLMQLLMAKIIDPDVYFRFVALCSKERSYTTIRTVCQQLDLLSGIAEQSVTTVNACVSFLRGQIERLGLSPRQEEDPGDGILREFVSLQLAKIDLDFARKMAEKLSEYDSLAPEIRAAVSIGYARTFENAYDTLVNMLKRSKTEGEREKLYMGLVCLEDPELVLKAIELSASGEFSRTDVFWTLVFASRTATSRRIAWEWLEKNYEKLWDLLGSTLFVLNMLQYVTPRAAIEDEAKARAFFSGDRLQKGEMSLRQDLEMLHAYAELRNTLLEKY
ncbi:MAG: M1 family metallopeptidase [Nitrososphaerales archaeon]